MFIIYRIVEQREREERMDFIIFIFIFLSFKRSSMLAAIRMSSF